jgi:hypothetical protein
MAGEMTKAPQAYDAMREMAKEVEELKGEAASFRRYVIDRFGIAPQEIVAEMERQGIEPTLEDLKELFGDDC